MGSQMPSKKAPARFENMKPVKNLLSSISYYKKYNTLFFIVFSIGILSLTFLETLIQAQHLKFQLILARWDLVTNIIPDLKHSALTAISSANNTLIERYEFAMNLVLTSIIVALAVLTWILLYKRRRDISALLSFGVKLPRIIFQFTLESLFPIALSFLALATCLFFFQLDFQKSATSVNNRQFDKEVIYQTTARDQGDTIIEGSETKESPPALLPFNASAFYYVDSVENVSTNTQVFSILSHHFLFLVGIVLFISILSSFTFIHVVGKSMFK